MIATLDFIQDVLSGLNVRAYNYLDGEEDQHVARLIEAQDRETDPVLIPFAVLVYDDGLDYDLDGNAYFDDYPGDHYASGHRSRKGAEVEAAYLEAAGIESHRISIVENYYAARYELDYHPIRD